MHILYGMDSIQFSSFTETCSQGSDWQISNIGSGNGLAPNRRQATTWTNDDQVHWRMYAALGEKPIRGYSIPDENLVDMNMYM